MFYTDISTGYPDKISSIADRVVCGTVYDFLDTSRGIQNNLELWREGSTRALETHIDIVCE